MTGPRLPSFHTMARHFTLGVGLITILLLQVVTLEATAPNQLSEHIDTVYWASLFLAAYTILPMVSFALRAFHWFVADWRAGGETT